MGQQQQVSRPYMRHLSELARRVMHAADQVAVECRHPSTGIGHLLLVLTLEERSGTAPILRENGMDHLLLLRDLNHPPPALLNGVDPVAEAALIWAKQVGSHYTGTEHLLLAIVTDPDGKLLIARYRADVEAVYQHLQVRLGE